MLKAILIQVRLVAPVLLLTSHPGLGVEEKYNSGWLINLDNDLMTEQDHGYTGGVTGWMNCCALTGSMPNTPVYKCTV